MYIIKRGNFKIKLDNRLVSSGPGPDQSLKFNLFANLNSLWTDKQTYNSNSWVHFWMKRTRAYSKIQMFPQPLSIHKPIKRYLLCPFFELDSEAVLFGFLCNYTLQKITFSYNGLLTFCWEEMDWTLHGLMLHQNRKKNIL